MKAEEEEDEKNSSKYDSEDEGNEEAEDGSSDEETNDGDEEKEGRKRMDVMDASKGRPPSGRPSSKKASKRDCVTFCVSECKYPVVKDAARKQGWKLIKAKSTGGSDSDEPHRLSNITVPRNCYIYWVDIANINERFTTLSAWQRINHFPGMTNIARKNRMAQHLDRARRKFLSDFSFYPRTWVLPLEYQDFRTQFDSHGKTNKIFIIKPDSGCQGKGIFLTQNLEEVDPSASQVAQIYMKRPLLIDGYKFDLRLYVLITSVKPLRMYLCHDGLVRLCTEEYVAPSADNLDDQCMHLTNYAINKKSENFEANTGASSDEGKGSKRSLKWFLEWVKEEAGEKKAKQLFERMGFVSVKTVLSILPLLQREYSNIFETSDGIDCGIEGSRCFEILGVDVMVDSSYKIWLVEVNHLPSFATDSPLDWRIKSKVVNQTVSILRVKPSDKRLWKEYSKDRAERRQQHQKIRQMRNADPSLVIKEKILAIYQKNCPEKIPKVQALFQKYKGREQKLLNAVEKKYLAGSNSSPAPMPIRSESSTPRSGTPIKSPRASPSPSSLMPPTPPWDAKLPQNDKLPGAPRSRKSSVAALERAISFKDVMDKDMSDEEEEAENKGNVDEQNLDGDSEMLESEVDPYAIGPDGVSLQDKGYYITPEIAKDIAYEDERLVDFDRIFPPQDDAKRKGKTKLPNYQKIIDFIFEQDMKRYKRMNCPIGQKHRNALEFSEVGSLPEVDAKFKSESGSGAGGRDWGGLLAPSAGGFGWRAPPALDSTEVATRVPGPKQMAAAERLSKGYASHRRNQSAPSQTGYNKDTDGLSTKVSQAMQYGKQYRQKIADRMERKSMVAVKINTLSLMGLPDQFS